MKRLLWLGSYLTDELSGEYALRGYRNAASVVSQKNLLEGLEQVLGQRFDTIGMLTLRGFPADRSLLLRERRFSHAEGAKDVQVGYLNLRYLNRLTGKSSLCRAVKKWLKGIDCRNDELVVYIYEMRSACLAAAEEIKRRMPQAQIRLIVPDLPQFMDLNMSRVKKVLKTLDWRSIRRHMGCVDHFILYTEPMAEFLGLPEGKWTLMEGSINIREVGVCPPVCDEPEDGRTVVMYSGNVNARYGVMELVRAFEHLDEGYELWITGAGKAAEQVKEAADRDERIRFFGFLPTRAELLSLQQKATMFINMRDPGEEASAYCFPSKLFEYMRSGKPVLSCRLEGIPGEYFQHLIGIRSFDPEGIAEAIRAVGEMSAQERAALGQRQFAFVAENKNNIAQAQRIVPEGSYAETV